MASTALADISKTPVVLALLELLRALLGLVLGVLELIGNGHCRPFPPPVESLCGSSIKSNCLKREKLLGFSALDKLPTREGCIKINLFADTVCSLFSR